MDAHELWAAAQLTPGEGIEDGAARVEALIAKDRADAARYRTLMRLLQGSYDDGAGREHEDLSVACSMQSGWRTERRVCATLQWKDVRDEPLDLSSALDRVEQAGGET